jgi:crotonobetainyl-CoA:carnitine CoA-transferase CaiB-like acyl-CoA transferase
MTGSPLAGVRVLDVTGNIAGPCATMILAGLGADVIKLERPDTGDDARRMSPIEDGWSAYFVAINRGKRSLAVDLSKPEGVALALRVASGCDVFIENFRGGKAEAMGLGEAAVRGARPGIIYASLSAFGPRGPEYAKPGYDALLQARTGIQSVTGEPGTAGARAGVSILDMGSGIWVALGVVAALLERQRSGEGCRVNGSLYQTGVMWMAYQLVDRQITGMDPRPQGTRNPAFAPYGDFATADGRVLIGISNNRLYELLCRAMERPELAQDPRFAVNADRVRNLAALDAELARSFTTRTTSEWLDRFDQAGVPAGPIQNAGQVIKDPQLAALGQMQPLAELPGVSTPALPLEFSGFKPQMGPVPKLGQHSREVLLEAGLRESEIAELERNGIVQCLG